MKTKEILFWLSLIIVVLFLCFCFFRFFSISTTYDSVCKVKYGDDWNSNFDDDWNSNFDDDFKRLCIHLNYSEFKIDDYAPYPDRDEIKEICNVPKFFSFKGGNLCE